MGNRLIGESTMKKLMFGAAAVALVTACSGEDAPTEVKIEEPTLKELTVRTGNPAEAANALAAMSLTESGKLTEIEARWLQDATGVPLIE